MIYLVVSQSSQITAKRQVAQEDGIFLIYGRHMISTVRDSLFDAVLFQHFHDWFRETLDS